MQEASAWWAIRAPAQGDCSVQGSPAPRGSGQQASPWKAAAVAGGSGLPHPLLRPSSAWSHSPGLSGQHGRVTVSQPTACGSQGRHRSLGSVKSLVTPHLPQGDYLETQSSPHCWPPGPTPWLTRGSPSLASLPGVGFSGYAAPGMESFSGQGQGASTQRWGCSSPQKPGSSQHSRKSADEAGSTELFTGATRGPPLLRLL